MSVCSDLLRIISEYQSPQYTYLILLEECGRDYCGCEKKEVNIINKFEG